MKRLVKRRFSTKCFTLSSSTCHPLNSWNIAGKMEGRHAPQCYRFCAISSLFGMDFRLRSFSFPILVVSPPFHPPQVLSMWEDAFTGMFKFRARWLAHALDLPKDALSRLKVARQALKCKSDENVNSSPGSLTKDETHLWYDGVGDNEVFLTPRMEDLEVRFIVKPITLSVSTSTKTETLLERRGKMGPQLTQTFNECSGDFAFVEVTDPILKRAKSRRAEAVALASRVEQTNEAAKSGRPAINSNGWLLPKRGMYDRRGKGYGVDPKSLNEIGKGQGSSRNSGSGSATPPTPDNEVEGSDPEEPLISDDEWKEDDDSNGDTTDTDADLPKKTTAPEESFTPRKSARQQKSQRSPVCGAEIKFDSEVSTLSPPPTIVPSPQTRRRSPPTKRQGPLPPRPRRLAMPAVAGDTMLSLANAYSPTAPKAARPVRTRLATGSLVKPPQATPRFSPKAVTGTMSRNPSIAGKRKRGGGAKMSEKDIESDYPIRDTRVGMEYQAIIPDVLPAEERTLPRTGTGARMVSAATSAIIFLYISYVYTCVFSWTGSRVQ